MTKQEAFEICKLVKNTYNIEFTTEKIDVWLEFLTNEADYEPSLQAAKRYIKEGNTYPPNIAHLLHKKPKIENKSNTVSEETKEHLWRMENDREYREENKRLKMALRQKMNELDQRMRKKAVDEDE